MVAQRSELGVDPGTMIPSSFGKHFERRVPMRLFQSEVDLNMKLFFDKSRLTIGSSSRILVQFLILPPGWHGNTLNSEIGTLNFIILNNSMNVC